MTALETEQLMSIVYNNVAQNLLAIFHSVWKLKSEYIVVMQKTVEFFNGYREPASSAIGDGLGV